MKTSLKSHFYQNMGKNSELIGFPVKINNEDDIYYINDFDQMVDNDKLPRTVFISKKLGSNYGNFINSSELYVGKSS